MAGVYQSMVRGRAEVVRSAGVVAIQVVGVCLE